MVGVDHGADVVFVDLHPFAGCEQSVDERPAVVDEARPLLLDAWREVLHLLLRDRDFRRA